MRILNKRWNLSGAAWGWAGILPGFEIQEIPISASMSEAEPFLQPFPAF